MTQTLKTKLTAVLSLALCVAFLAPAVAGAQQVSPTTDQYGSELTQVSQSTTPPSDTGLGSRVGPLPFTGFDVIAMAAVALAVTGLGLGLQRAVSRQTSDESAAG
jgi:hypothetical protein